MTNLIGPDVSFYQDDNATSRMIDFDQMRKHTPYVFIRAGQNTWTDQDLAENMKRAKAAGLKRGTYWFFDSRVSPAKQAELYISSLKGDLGELPLVADFEEKYGGPYQGWRHWYDFIAAIQKLAPGKELLIYTAYYYWVEQTANVQIPQASLEWFGQFGLWIAGYRVNTPRIPKPWADGGWTFWQYTDKGNGPQYGAESMNIDLNYFNGDEAAFNKRFKIDTTPTPPDPQPEPTEDAIIGATVFYNSGKFVYLVPKQ